MDKTAQITLVKPKYKLDALNQKIPDGEILREIYCEKKNLTRSEWFSAAQLSFKAAWCVTIWVDEYQGETTAILDDTRYGIYRTYQPNSEELELYLEQKAGA